MTTTFNMTMYHTMRTLRFRSRFNLSLPRGRLACLCIVDCLIIFEFVSHIAWNHMTSCLSMYCRLIPYVLQIACLGWYHYSVMISYHRLSMYSRLIDLVIILTAPHINYSLRPRLRVTLFHFGPSPIKSHTSFLP